MGAGLAHVRRTHQWLLIVAIVLGVPRERARHPAAGRERRRRVAVGLAQRHGPRKHAGKPLREGVGSARDRLAGARVFCWQPAWRSRAARATGRARMRRRRADAAAALGGTPPRWLLVAGRRVRGLSGGHARAIRPREHPEPDGRLLPLRRAACAGGERVGRGHRLPAARAARRDPSSSRSQRSRLLLATLRAVLAAGADRGDRDRRHRGRAGLHRRAQPQRPASTAPTAR